MNDNNMNNNQDPNNVAAPMGGMPQAPAMPANNTMPDAPATAAAAPMGGMPQAPAMPAVVDETPAVDNPVMGSMPVTEPVANEEALKAPADATKPAQE